MYGSGGSGGGTQERKFTPRGQMSSGVNSKPALGDLLPHMQAMFKSRDFYPHKAQIGDQILEPSLVNHTGLANYLDRFEKDKKDTKPGIWPICKKFPLASTQS